LSSILVNFLKFAFCLYLWYNNAQEVSNEKK